MSEYLPEEVLIEIFLKLPTKFIIQCTSLSKSWYSLITSPNFIFTHVNQNQDEYLLVRNARGMKFNTLFCDNEDFDQYAQLVDFPFERESYFNVVGICNGILCLCSVLRAVFELESIKIPKLYLWNPSIRKSVKLPNPILGFETDSPFDLHHNLGFGFDHVTNDYKVVRIVHTGIDKPSPQVELYKLSTGVWQDITHVAPSVEFSEMPGVYVNGAFHWVANAFQERVLAFQGGVGRNVIVQFDMHSETFHEMVVPSSLVELSSHLLWLFTYEKSLCLVKNLPLLLSADNTKNFDIWMMKDYGDPQSWVKQFSIRLQYTVLNAPTDFPYFGDPIALRKNGEILWTTCNNHLISYDPASGKIKHTGIFVYPSTTYVNTYKSSLVLLGPIKGA